MSNQRKVEDASVVRFLECADEPTIYLEISDKPFDHYEGRREIHFIRYSYVVIPSGPTSDSARSDYERGQLEMRERAQEEAENTTAGYRASRMIADLQIKRCK
jgi:hypothetical protein